MGRKTTLTPELIETLCNLVEKGNFITTVAAKHGVPRGTIYQWLEKGTAELERIQQGVTPHQRAEQGLPTETSQALYASFADRVNSARAYAEVSVVASIHEAIKGGVKFERKLRDGTLEVEYARPDGRLGLELLARTSPERFGRRTQIDVETTHSGTVTVEVTEASRIASRLEDFQRRLAANPAMLDAAKDEEFARRVIDVPPARVAIGVGSSDPDTTDNEDTEDSGG